MFGSTFLDVAIGLGFVYLLLSVICLSVVEFVELLAKARAKVLERAVESLLQDKVVAQQLYSHPLIRGLYQGESRPSYIPTRAFASALVSLLVPEGAREGADAKTLRRLIERENEVPIKDPLKEALLTLLDRAEGSLARLRSEVEIWYDQAMDRASGRYKRRAQVITFVVAAAVVGALNVDSIQIMKQLSSEPTTRAAFVAMAEARSKAPAPSSEADQTFEGGLKKIVESSDALAGLGLKLGWARQPSLPGSIDLAGFLTKALGLLLSVFAASLGAPFWFDVLGKFVVIRSTVKPHEKSPEEGSKDVP